MIINSDPENFFSASSNEELEIRFDTVGVPYCGVPFFVGGLKILQCQSFKEKNARGGSKKKEIKIEVGRFLIIAEPKRAQRLWDKPRYAQVPN